MMERIALAVPLHGVDESSLVDVVARLLLPPPADRTWTKGVSLRVLVVVDVVVAGITTWLGRVIAAASV